MTSGRFYERSNKFKIRLSMARDTAVDGDLICIVRLSITPGDEMLSIEVKPTHFFFHFCVTIKSIVTLLYDIDKINIK